MWSTDTVHADTKPSSTGHWSSKSAREQGVHWPCTVAIHQWGWTHIYRDRQWGLRSIRGAQEKVTRFFTGKWPFFLFQMCNNNIVLFCFYFLLMNNLCCSCFVHDCSLKLPHACTHQIHTYWITCTCTHICTESTPQNFLSRSPTVKKL